MQIKSYFFYGQVVVDVEIGELLDKFMDVVFKFCKIVGSEVMIVFEILLIKDEKIMKVI